ncbi:MAG: transcriptional repressor [Endomicrobia bacterium]|nr:transcriptional repressor [Endomicrobiia bacterium]
MKSQANNISKEFLNILKQKKLRNTKQRQQILQIFSSSDKHISVDDLYHLVKKTNPKIGYATVYRTLKLLTDFGIAEGIKIGNQKKLYEHKYNHKHHDHLVCIKCGKFIEIISDEIEGLQEKVAKENNFDILDHRLIIYGVCKKCKHVSDKQNVLFVSV